MVTVDYGFYFTTDAILEGIQSYECYMVMQELGVSEWDLKNPDSKAVEARATYESRKEVWASYFSIIPEEHMDVPLNNNNLSDPKQPIVQLFLYLYTLDTWLFQELNKASRE